MLRSPSRVCRLERESEGLTAINTVKWVLLDEGVVDWPVTGNTDSETYFQKTVHFL